MNFRSIYQHGFARVAACTSHVAIADPPANADAVLRQARACSDEGVAVALFPELCLTGYSIEDLLLQDAVLDGVETALADGRRGLRRPAAADRVRRAAAAPQPGLQLRGRRPPRPDARRRSRSPTCRPTASSTSGGSSRPATTSAARSASAARTCRSAPTCCSPPSDVPGLVVHVEVCEDMWIPVPPSAEAALAGATVLLNLSGSPITVGRAEDRKLLCRSASLPLPGRLRLRRRRRRASRRPTWRGTARRRSTRTACCSPRPSASRTATAGRSPTSTSTCCSRSGSGWGRSTTTGARTPRAPARSAAIGFTLDPPDGDLGLRRSVERYPFVPADPDRLNLDCYEAYNIQVAGLQQRLRAIGDPKVVIGVSGGLDSTHALIVAAQAMDRAGRPRSDILGFTLPGFATSDGTKANAHRLMARARRHRRGARHHARPPS